MKRICEVVLAAFLLVLTQAGTALGQQTVVAAKIVGRKKESFLAIAVLARAILLGHEHIYRILEISQKSCPTIFH